MSAPHIALKKINKANKNCYLYLKEAWFSNSFLFTIRRCSIIIIFPLKAG